MSAPAGFRGSVRDRDPSFVCVSTVTVPEVTLSLLRTACARRGVRFHVAASDRPGPPTTPALEPGDLLYRAGTSRRAMAVERGLFRRDLATFHSSVHGPHNQLSFTLALFSEAGLMTPGYAEDVTADRRLLREHVDRLGGLPVVVKVTGGSRGLGVMIADTLRGLFSLTDYLISLGAAVTLMTYVEPAVHWRVIVVGSHAVAAYVNVREDDDFRTHASSDPADYLREIPGPLADLALRSAGSLHIELGGVDILEDRFGRLHLLECNFPCYFAAPQLVAGIDVAGAMLDHLLIKGQAMRVPAGASSQEGLPVAVHHKDPAGEITVIETCDVLGHAAGAHVPGK